MKDKERAKRYAKRKDLPWWVGWTADPVPHWKKDVAQIYAAGLRMGRKLEREGK